MRTENRIPRLFWVYFFALTVHGYGDFEDLNVENNTQTLEAMSYEPAVMLDRHPRVRRAAGDSTGMKNLGTVVSTHWIRQHETGN